MRTVILVILVGITSALAQTVPEEGLVNKRLGLIQSVNFAPANAQTKQKESTQADTTQAKPELYSPIKPPKRTELDGIIEKWRVNKQNSEGQAKPTKVEVATPVVVRKPEAIEDIATKKLREQFQGR